MEIIFEVLHFQSGDVILNISTVCICRVFQKQEQKNALKITQRLGEKK